MENYLTPRSGLKTVKFWRSRLKACDGKDKKRLEICHKNLSMAKEQMNYLKSIQSTQLKLEL